MQCKRVYARPLSRYYRPHRLSLAVALAASLAATAQAQSTTGALGVPESWITPEFEANKALGMIQAQHAYARGLSGRGIWIGIADSGVMFDHPEFSGADKQAITLADPLATGGRCAESNVMTEGACFHSTGDTPQVVFRDIPANAPEALLKVLIDNGERPGASFEEHGTGVASQALARRNGIGMHGVAYAANLASLRAQSHLYKDTAAIAEQPNGIGISVTNHPRAWLATYANMAGRGVRVVNNSWDFDPIDPEDEDAAKAQDARTQELDALADAARTHGMIQVWAAGNDAAKPPGEGAMRPASAPDVEKLWLAVTNLKDAETLDDSSTRCGKTAQWCISAPGTDLSSASIDPERSKADATPIRNDEGKVTGLEVKRGAAVGGYKEMSGSSFAAPVATGALALLMERYPYLDNAQVRDVLLTTAKDLGAPGVDPVFGWGALDLRKAIDGPGQLRVDTDVVMNQRAGGAKVWRGDAWDEWRNDIGGPGRLGKRGQGWLRLAGNNSFAGADVREGTLELTGNNRLGAGLNVHEGGRLIVDGSATGGLTTVERGGVLEGNGTLGATRVGGVISPGSPASGALGTLQVQGDYTQLAGATYQVDLGPAGASDRLAVTGKARIQGGLLQWNAASAIDLLGQEYTVLTAAQGVEGRFADAASVSPFLAMRARYTPTTARLGVARGLALASAATTANQRAVAAAADKQNDKQPLLRKMLVMSAPQVRQSFDALSGEVHASTRALLVEGSRIARETLLQRTGRGDGGLSITDEQAPAHGLWARADHQDDRLKSDGNSAAARFDGNTLLAGYDVQLDGGWTLGAMLGHGKGEANVADRKSKAKVQADHIGLYAGQHWGPWGVGAGYVHSRQRVKSQRTVSLPGLEEALAAKYDTHADQAFVEGTYRWSNGRVAMEPFLQYAFVRQADTRFRETGGLAALDASSPTQSVHIGTAGLRWQAALGGPNPGALSLRGQLAYRQASREFTPTLTAQWSGADTFQIQGAPLARNATLAGVSLLARPSRNTELEFGYGGVFSRRGRDASINARFAWKF